MSKMLRYPVYFGGDRSGFIEVPDTIKPADCEMLRLTLSMVRAYAEQRPADEFIPEIPWMREPFIPEVPWIGAAK